MWYYLQDGLLCGVAALSSGGVRLVCGQVLILARPQSESEARRRAKRLLAPSLECRSRLAHFLAFRVRGACYLIAKW